MHPGVKSATSPCLTSLYVSTISSGSTVSWIGGDGNLLNYVGTPTSVAVTSLGKTSPHSILDWMPLPEWRTWFYVRLVPPQDRKHDCPQSRFNLYLWNIFIERKLWQPAYRRMGNRPRLQPSVKNVDASQPMPL